MVASIILGILEDFLYDILKKCLRGWLDNRRYKGFIRELKEGIVAFCEKNSGDYINSDAFVFFLRNSKLLNKIVENIFLTGANIKKECVDDAIIRAKEIAASEYIFFGKEEEQLIRNLCEYIEDKVRWYYLGKLSAEQRCSVNSIVKSLDDLNNSIAEFKQDNYAQHKEVLNVIKEVNKLSRLKAEIIANLYVDMLLEGRFTELDSLATVIEGKSDNLLLFSDSLLRIIRSNDCDAAVKNIASIERGYIKDCAIRSALPILFFRKEKIDCLKNLASSQYLNTIVNSLADRNYSELFSEEIYDEKGVELHEFRLNKTLLLEEECLLKQIAIIALYSKNIKNVCDAMENLESGCKTWLTRLLITDKKIDEIIFYNTGDNSVIVKLEAVLSLLDDYSVTYENLNDNLKAFFQSIKVKVYFSTNQFERAERFISESLKNIRPLSDYVLALRNIKKETELKEVMEYVTKYKTKWLLRHYFISRGDEQEFVSFCGNHEELFEEDWTLFFMYLGALKVLNNQEERVKQLRKNADKLGNYYEYWNELLDIDDSLQIRNEFMKACKNGQMKGLLNCVEYNIIDRLLSFDNYEVAETYIEKLSRMGVNNYRTKRYKAAVEQYKGHDIEALKAFKELFRENTVDAYVVESLIMLSIKNKRKVETKVIEAAEKIDTSMSHMLAAECYSLNGNITKAKIEIIKAILLSNGAESGVYAKYIAIETSFQNDSIVSVTSIEVDTAALCVGKEGRQFYFCVYKDSVLPESPYIWNGDFHVLVQDAAKMRVLRKRKGDLIVINCAQYEIKEILPIDSYLFRTCVSKLSQNGVAKEVRIPIVDGQIETKAFISWMEKNLPSYEERFDWVNQYNNLQDITMPIFFYKGFVNRTYLQHVDIIISSKEFIIRESYCNSKKNKRYVISFSTLILLYKMGLPSENISMFGGCITSSTRVQIDSDVDEIIINYSRDTVASMGTVDGKLFINEADDNMKAFWLEEAGKIKEYCKNIPAVDSDKDLSGPFFEEIDTKRIFGICDYDAISYVKNNNEYSLLAVESMLTSLATNEQAPLNVAYLSDWLLWQNISYDELLCYLKTCMGFGCLFVINKNVVIYLSDTVQNLDDIKKNDLYKKWYDLLISIDEFDEKYKLVAFQALSSVFSSIEGDIENIDKGILNIFVDGILFLNKKKVDFYYDKGKIYVGLVDLDATEQVVSVDND